MLFHFVLQSKLEGARYLSARWVTWILQELLACADELLLAMPSLLLIRLLPDWLSVSCLSR